MKLALIFGFIAVASAYPRGGVITKSAYTGGYGVITRGVITNESILDNAKCDGPQCSGGCCPESAYVCCESGSFCASTLEECPQYPEGGGVITKGVITKGVNPKGVITKGVNPKGVITKGAITKGVITKGVITKDVLNLKLISDDSRCNGPQCQGGCCPESGYFCCEGGNFCAATPEACPHYPELYPDESFVKKLDLTREECQGTNCPGGCCYGVYDWFCCEDGVYCVISPEYCRGSKMEKFFKLLK